MSKVVIVILFFVSIVQGNYEIEILQRDIQIVKGLIQVSEQKLGAIENYIYANKRLTQIDEQNIRLIEQSNTLIQLEKQISVSLKNRLPALNSRLESLSQIYQLSQLEFGLIRQGVENFQREIQIYQDEIYESQRDIQEYQIDTKNNLKKITQLQAKIQDLQQRVGALQEMPALADAFLSSLKVIIEDTQKNIQNSRGEVLKKTAKLTVNEMQQVGVLLQGVFLQEIQETEKDNMVAQNMKTETQNKLQQYIRQLQMSQQELKKIKK